MCRRFESCTPHLTIRCANHRRDLVRRPDLLPAHHQRPSIQYLLEIYARRGWVAQQVVLALLFALFMLGVAFFNWTGEDALRVPAALLAAFPLYLAVKAGRSRRRPILRLDREALTCRWSYVWMAWWRPKHRFALELTVRWSDLRRISIVQVWPSRFALIEFYVRPNTPGVHPQGCERMGGQHLPSFVRRWISPSRASSRSSRAIVDRLSTDAGRSAVSGRGGEDHAARRAALDRRAQVPCASAWVPLPPNLPSNV
jgi:hypothetical protein